MGRFSSPVIDGVRSDGLIPLPYEQLFDILAIVDVLPLTLFGALPPAVAARVIFERTVLDDTSWVDVARDFLLGADSLFDALVEQLPFTQSRRLMYNNWVDEPRLNCGLDLSHAPPVVRSLARALRATYGVVFDSCFVNYYRDGHDSVTWHSDREGRSILDPMVAIVSLGGTRRFGLRPKGGGASHGFTLYSGDALVMGGACQHRFEHRVPKMASAAPRMSLSFRHH